MSLSPASGPVLQPEGQPISSGNGVTLSIIIVTRNTCAQVCAAVRSVFDSQDDFSKTVVVVDNASTDNTVAALAQQSPTVKQVQAHSNLGFAKAANLGARAASGEFLLLLNSDAWLKPDTLGKAIAWMRQNPRCGIAGAQLLNPDGSRQNSIANLPTLATELLNKSLLRRLFPHRFPGKEVDYNGPIEVESVIGAFMLIRRELWQQLNGLDERFFFFLEETDFCFQARRRGWKVFHLPHVQVWHEQGQSARQWPAAARLEYWRSRYCYFQKNARSFTRGLLRLGLCLRLAVEWLFSGLLVLATLGTVERWRRQWRTHTLLCRWHLSGCPATMGLPR